ncbi:MAG: phosphopentomutase [Clostridia bacterium]|nr:phosphopentomutase [Clostridia bacterium]
MRRYKRVFMIVLDSLGIGAMPDAVEYGDEGADTLRSLYNTGRLNIPNLIKLGLGNIKGVDYLPRVDKPLADCARMMEKSRGKDTTTGHWELMGIISEKPMPTYPGGFPDEIISAFEERIGRECLCNRPYSGTEVIRDYGEEHIVTGKPIVYTSADSVFQIAAHESIVPREQLYAWCEIAREILVGEHGVGRVIARPFIGEKGSFTRTDGRRDFSLKPPKESYIERMQRFRLQTVAVGKIQDIFAGVGIDEHIPTHSNAEGIAATLELLERDFTGFAFINLVDFDMKYGHRQDAVGYAEALNEFDKALGDMIKKMEYTDMLIITADHGCDPSDNSTDHTREYVPFLCYTTRGKGGDLGTLNGFDQAGRLTLWALDFTGMGGGYCYDVVKEG